MVYHPGLPQPANLFQLPAECHGQVFVRARWGASDCRSLEWLLHYDPSPIITVTGPQPAIIYVNLSVLSSEEQKRIWLTNSSAVCYYHTAYRWHPQSYADSLGPKVLSYRPGRRIKTLSIFRRDSLRRPPPPAPSGWAPLP